MALAREEDNSPFQYYKTIAINYRNVSLALQPLLPKL